MHRVLRASTLVLLPLVTLFLGWQLGVGYEQRHIQQMTEELELLYTGKTASGQLLTDPEREVDLSLMWGVWRLLLKYYIEPDKLNPPEMIYGAVGGLVRSAGDQYTTFMTPKENTDFKQSLQGNLEGIGAELTMRDDHVTVVNPLKGSPAAAAGIEPEDVILEVDGVDVEGETLNQVVQRIRGPKGTTVVLTIWRKGDIHEVNITRDKITVPSVEYDIILTQSGSVGVVTLNQFGQQSVHEVSDALKAVRNEGVDALVLDLRFNGGGYLDGAVQIASMFLKQGKVVTVERREGDPTNHYVSGRPSDPEIPLVVLINEGSASSSEILAGALQDHKRATIIGKTSFGKGTVQEVFDLPGNASVRITTAKWLTPNGKDLGKEGVHPDIEVDRTREQIIDNIDPQMDAAVEWLLDGENITASDEEI